MHLDKPIKRLRSQVWTKRLRSQAGLKGKIELYADYKRNTCSSKLKMG